MDIGYNERSRNGVTSTIPAPDVRPTRDRQNAVANAKPIPQLSPEQIERFWSKVEVPEQPSCCWEWTGYRLPTGYGDFNFGNSALKAHRVSYTLLIGPIPDGLVIDHLCRNTSCVNPDHLEITTQRENIRRGYSYFGIARRKTHCSRGHAFSTENTYLVPSGGRSCKECRRANNRQWRKPEEVSE